MHTLHLSAHSNGHTTPAGHPEHPGRIAAFLAGVHNPNGRPLPLTTVATVAAAHGDLTRAHTEAYLARMAEPVPLGVWDAIDADTGRATGSWEAALHSAGGTVDATRRVLDGRSSTAFVAARPAGHHALADKAMGFCLLGNAAIAALAAVEQGARVAVLDFDVHHGNGTQALLWNAPNTLFASTHVLNAWPQTGRADEVGAHGTFLNRPLKRSAGDRHAEEAWTGILDEVRAFAPDVLIVSAGFDAHQSDPLGSMRWTTPTYRFLGDAIRSTAEAVCNGRVVSLLEGGYDGTVLARAGRAYLDGLLFGMDTP
jgi:acetoin utilization deacetylase AcuC-like enzyme